MPAVGGVFVGGGVVYYLNHPGIDTKFVLKWPVVRVHTRGAKWGQRTGRGKLSLNYV